MGFTLRAAAPPDADEIARLNVATWWLQIVRS